MALYDRLHRGAALRPERDGDQFGVGRRTMERDIGVLVDILGHRLERVDERGVGVVYRLPRAARRWKLTPLAAPRRRRGHPDDGVLVRPALLDGDPAPARAVQIPPPRRVVGRRLIPFVLVRVRVLDPLRSVADNPPMQRRRKKGSPNGAPRVDTLTIGGPGLGPVRRCELAIRPLTVFVGPQGSGKSLVAQVLYAFEELPFLVQYVQGKERDKLDAEALFSRILDQLRSTERRFARFSSGTTTIKWHRGEEWEVAGRDEIEFSMYRATHRTRAAAQSQLVVEAMASRGVRPKRHAVFVPTERMVVSQLRSALSERVLSLPITYELFADWLDLASRVQPEIDAPEARLIARLSEEALGGYAKRVGEHWRWSFSGRQSRETLDLDMASSGQRANWSLGYLGRALFALRTQRAFARVLTVLVEEPELHLHPAAQVKTSQLIAVLVNAGFRVVVTTHSLNIIYALNNLLLAHKRFQLEKGRGLPDPATRLRVDDVAVYDFADGVPRDIVDRDEAFIDEHALGDVGASLGEEMNTLLNRAANDDT